MTFSKKSDLFLRNSLAFLVTLLLLRIYEYFEAASRQFISQAYRFELAGLFYDVWLWLLISAITFLLFILLARWRSGLALFLLHTLQVLLLLGYISLILAYSERNTPFDHELFTRKAKDSFETIKQMMTKSGLVFLPFLVYLPIYVLLCRGFRKLEFTNRLKKGWMLLTLAALLFIPFAQPSPSWFRNSTGYYLTSNKLSYWVRESYQYFRSGGTPVLKKGQLGAVAKYYQENQPFTFTDPDYPLLHLNRMEDPLGPYFRFQSSPPNIVLLVVEGLSRDFSGKDAYASSFTPFLDSLSEQGLVWNNFLSTAPGTFAAHPAITGSLPYGEKGFSIMNRMPAHVSLISILRKEGYYTQFLAGFNTDFDNMGGYIRLQGTDFILSRFGKKYKEMGIGEEGWSMGYPDDALFNRSFEVLDSIRRTPYLSVYHTGTTHMPYLFEQKSSYEKLFDKKLASLNVSGSIRRTLKQTKEVLVTFMFSDDCLRKFFQQYQQRKEYSNTIFVITGDHHIGSFPSTGEIDDYHVPFIIYSPLLNRHQRFLSVNSHNNIAPSLTNLLLHNFRLPYQPEKVSWLGDVLDTATQFRNKQSMAFMSWSREINDYLNGKYFLSGEQLVPVIPHSFTGAGYQ
jgi:phosphoglycerol transferase MdoB-like AlkP superfamily enzyme